MGSFEILGETVVQSWVVKAGPCGQSLTPTADEVRLTVVRSIPASSDDPLTGPVSRQLNCAGPSRALTADALLGERLALMWTIPAP